jgi:hypothetical protein
MIKEARGILLYLQEFRGVVICVTQLLGGITAAALIDALTPGSLSVANGLGRKSPVQTDNCFFLFR